MTDDSVQREIEANQARKRDTEDVGLEEDVIVDRDQEGTIFDDLKERIFGDDDGVVLLPEPLVAELVSASLDQEDEERYIADQVRSGASIDGLYPLNAEWRARYEAARERDPS